MDDEMDSLGVRCDVRLIVGLRARKKTITILSSVVRCVVRVCKNCRSNPDSDHRGLGQLNKI